MTNTASSRELDSALVSGLMDLSVSERTSKDRWGNGFHWVVLEQTALLPQAAALLAEYDARLCTVTALHQSMSDAKLYVAYHFDVQGYTVTVTAALEGEQPAIPTITPWFRNADWNEREFAELYDVVVEGSPNPQRLFLDDSIDSGILNEVVPLSVMMNGACTTDMWERVMQMNMEKEQA